MQVYVALGMQGKHVAPRRMLPYTLLLVAALYLLRSLPGPFGLHVPVHVLLMILVVRHLGQGRWVSTILGVLTANLLIVVGEGLVAAPLARFFNLSFSDVMANPILNVAVGYVADFLLMVAFLYFYLRRRMGRT